MSYMQVVSYSQSGHAGSQLYGYYGLFVIGFLSAGLGGACMAYPAVENRECLTSFFKPLIIVLALWILLDLTEDRLDFWYRNIFFDLGPSLGWIFGALLGLCVFFRRDGKWRSASSLILYTGIARYVYHGTAVGGGSPMNNMRFGEKADWYIKPVLKHAPHR